MNIKRRKDYNISGMDKWKIEAKIQDLKLKSV